MALAAGAADGRRPPPRAYWRFQVTSWVLQGIVAFVEFIAIFSRLTIKPVLPGTGIETG